MSMSVDLSVSCFLHMFVCVSVSLNLAFHLCVISFTYLCNQLFIFQGKYFHGSVAQGLGPDKMITSYAEHTN